MKLAPGDVIVDAGAFIGDTAVFFHHKLAGRCQVHSFELLDENLALLVHNALAHAYQPGAHGEVVIAVRRTAGWLDVVVSDDGRGLPADFALEASHGLGLQIVRTLVESELGASLTMRPQEPRGTDAVLRVPLIRP